jgi:hypothetical protein
MLIDANRPIEALLILHEELAVQPDDVELLRLVASAYLGAPSSEENARAAADAAAHAARLEPDDEWTLRMLSAASSLIGEHDRAIDAALAAQRLAPDEWQSHVRLVHSDIAAARASRRTDAALVEARRIAPEEPDVYFAAGRLAMSRRKWKLAEQEYGEALRINPNHSGARNNLALVQLRTMRTGDAAAGFVGILRQDPTSELALYNLRGTAEMGLRIINLVLWLGLVVITASYRGLSATGFAFPGEDGAPSRPLVVTVASIASVAILAYLLWVRRRSAGNFRVFVRSIPHTDVMLVVWAGVLAASLAAIWIAAFVPSEVSRVVCSTDGAVLFVFLLIVVLRARRRRRPPGAKRN